MASTSRSQARKTSGKNWNLEAFGIGDDDSESSGDDDLQSLQLTSEDDHRHHGNAAPVALHPITALDDDASVVGNVSSHSTHFDNHQSTSNSEVVRSSDLHQNLAPIASLGVDIRPTPIFSLSEHPLLHHQLLPPQQQQQQKQTSSTSQFHLLAHAPPNRSLGPEDFLAPVTRFGDASSSTPRSSSGATTPSGDECNIALEVEEASQLLQSASGLLARLDAATTLREILSLPFPLFVFGTLRMHLSNNYLMGLPQRRESAVYSSGHFERDHQLALSLSGRPRRDHEGNAKYAWWAPAGVRHMVCDGLKIVPVFSAYDQQSSFDNADVGAAMGEIFAYDAENFAKVIGPVDDLENFSAGANGNSYQMCSYVRTLMWADVLPRSMRGHLTLDLGRRRAWSVRAFDGGCAELEGLRIPVWVYSSTFANMTVARHTVPGSVLLWAPHSVPASEVANGTSGQMPTRDYLTRH